MNLGKECLHLLILQVAIWNASGASYLEDVTLTATEKFALAKFKALVIPKIPSSSYIQNYKNDDLYFLQWIRARSLDVGIAEKSFLNHLKWREEQKIDSILEEDWSEFERDFPLFTDAVDKTGRPTLEAWFGDWNVRQAVLTGKSRQLARWMIRHLESLNRGIYAARAEGKKVSHGVVIATSEGFNLIRQGCPACLPVYASVVINYEAQYPRMAGDILFVDMPPSFQIVMNVLKSVMSRDSAKVLNVFRTKEDGLKALEKRFNKDQLSSRFGGTLVRNLLEF